MADMKKWPDAFTRAPVLTKAVIIQNYAHDAGFLYTNQNYSPKSDFFSGDHKLAAKSIY